MSNRGSLCFLTIGRVYIGKKHGFISISPDETCNCNLDEIFMDLSWHNINELKKGFDWVFGEEISPENDKPLQKPNPQKE